MVYPIQILSNLLTPSARGIRKKKQFFQNKIYKQRVVGGKVLKSNLKSLCLAEMIESKLLIKFLLYIKCIYFVFKMLRPK